MTTDKDWVRVADHQCPICGEIHKHNTELLLHKQGKAIKTDEDGHVVTGRSLCEKHDTLYKAGYLAMIVITDTDSTKIVIGEETRSGDMLHVRTATLKKMFKVTPPENTPMLFIDQEFYDMMVEVQSRSIEITH